MKKPDARQRTLRIAGIAGATLFAAFFALTYHRPEWVEDFAADYLEAKVAEKLDATIDAMAAPTGDDALSRYAAQLYRQNEARISSLRRLLKAEVRKQLEICIPQIRGLSAEQRERIAQWVEEGATLEHRFAHARQFTTGRDHPVRLSRGGCRSAARHPGVRGE